MSLSRSRIAEENMNDWELFVAMNDAEDKFLKLQAEFRKRGLDKKPFAEYSHSAQSEPLDCPVCRGMKTIPPQGSELLWRDCPECCAPKLPILQSDGT